MIDLKRMVIGVFSVAVFSVEAQVPLSEHAFRDLGGTKGIVILQVNWGRYWGCGRYENAQLQVWSFGA